MRTHQRGELVFPPLLTPDREHLDAPVRKLGRLQRRCGLGNETGIPEHFCLVEHDRIPAAQLRQPSHLGAQARGGHPRIIAQAEERVQAEARVRCKIPRHVAQRRFFQLFEQPGDLEQPTDPAHLRRAQHLAETGPDESQQLR